MFPVNHQAKIVCQLLGNAVAAQARISTDTSEKLIFEIRARQRSFLVGTQRGSIPDRCVQAQWISRPLVALLEIRQDIL